MGAGLLITYADGSRPLEITAGLRCPSFCMQTAQSGNNTRYTIDNYRNGSQVIVIPRVSALFYYQGTSSIPVIQVLSGYSVNGNQLNVYSQLSTALTITPRSYPLSVWQIFPVGQRANFGLLISDSTDFTSITDQTVIGQCIWYGTVTINGQWGTPTINGFDRSRYIVYAKWDSDQVIDFDGYTISVLNEKDGANVFGTATLQILIFCTGQAPVPGYGLNIINAAGACVFSTTKKPFVFRGANFVPSFNWQDVGNRLTPLGRFGYSRDKQGGWWYLKFAGMVRSGNSVRLARGYSWTTISSSIAAPNPMSSGMLLPLIENIYF